MRSSKWFVVLLSGVLLIAALACSRKEEAKTSEDASPATSVAPKDGAVPAHTQEPSSEAGSPPVSEAPTGEATAAPTESAEAPAATSAPAPTPTQLTWTAPAAWKEVPPNTPMRKAQYSVPAAKGDSEPAECAVFFFGNGQGGTAQANAQRWVDQFTQPDGSSSQSRSKIDVRTVNGNQVMFVQVHGTYNPMGMPGAAKTAPRPGYAMIGAIVSTADAPWFFKMTGPEKTVEANKDALDTLISSIRAAP